MVEAVYTVDLKSTTRKGLWVRVPLPVRNTTWLIGGMVYTLVLGTSAERRESSNLSWATRRKN